MASWNSSGDSSSAQPTASPSSTSVVAGNDRTRATILGSRSVTSLRLRVKSRTSSSRRWAWMRAPSSFHSTDASPVSSSASATVGADAASIGCTGRPTVRPKPPRSMPPRAARATTGSDPASIAARRTSAAGRPAAAATASPTSDSSAPWRSSPVSNRRSRSASIAVARPSSSRSTASRAATEPGPLVVANVAKPASTSPTVSDAGPSCTTASMRPATVAQPTPSRPCRVSPESHATTGSTSSGSRAPRSAAKALTLALRDRVADAAADAAATSAKRVTPGSVPRCRRSLGRDGHRDGVVRRERALVVSL